MATNLTWIGEKARKEPDLVFTSLYHHICDVDNLRACYGTLDADKAPGVDGVTKEEYGKNLEENLQDLLHYVLDLWFSRKYRKQCRGEAYYFRFADDFLACFQYREDAARFHQQLRDRLEAFGLKLAEEKTKCIEFGRFARQNAQQRGGKPKDFTFLGFTHYCGKNREGYFKVKRRTSRKKLGQSLTKFTDWARKVRGVLRKGEMIRQARTRVVGYLNYYAITDNAARCNYYLYCVRKILFKWLNRKSQRKSYTWEQFGRALARQNGPAVEIRKDLNPCRRAEAY